MLDNDEVRLEKTLRSSSEVASDILEVFAAHSKMGQLPASVIITVLVYLIEGVFCELYGDNDRTRLIIHKEISKFMRGIKKKMRDNDD